MGVVDIILGGKEEEGGDDGTGGCRWFLIFSARCRIS